MTLMQWSASVPKTKIDKPAYTPVTPFVDPLIGPPKRALFGVGTTPAGLGAAASGQRKVLIGGAV